MLIIMAGLPGTGKSTLSRRLARHFQAVHIRIDTIEHALARSDRPVTGPEGYVVGYAIAADNLGLGSTVIADSVNPLTITRAAWRDVASRAGVTYCEVEVVCSDPSEHRHRVESRQSDISGFRVPTWEEVVNREYVPWETDRIVIDTAGTAEDQSFARLLAALPQG